MHAECVSVMVFCCCMPPCWYVCLCVRKVLVGHVCFFRCCISSCLVALHHGPQGFGQGPEIRVQRLHVLFQLGYLLVCKRAKKTYHMSSVVNN